MAQIKPRAKLPKTAVAGEVIKIKTLLSHPMESGQRINHETGDLIPQDIMYYFSASFNGKVFFELDAEPALSTNPYIEFHLKVPESGTISFLWKTENDGDFTLERTIEVT